MSSISAVVQDLVEAFHNLEGRTVAEKKRPYHSYLNRLKVNTSGNPENLTDVVDNIVPRNYWEGILKVDIVLHFQLFERSLEILKSDNKLYVRKVINNTWFLKELLATFTAQQFVNELFTCVSVSARTKIINKLIKYNTDADFSKAFFMAYLEKYGLNASKQLLPMCSLEIIEDVVVHKELKPSSSTVHKIICRDKDFKLTKHLLKGYYSRYEIKYIAATDLPLFAKLLQDTDVAIQVSFGNSTTHKFLKNFKSYIISKPQKCLNMFKRKRISYDLKGEYEQMVHRLMVDTGAVRTYLGYLNHLSSKQQLEVYLKAFEQVFKCSLEEKPELIDETIIKLFENTDERDKFAEVKYRSVKEYEWIKYMHISKSIPLLKEKINLVNKPNVRRQMIDAMVDTCCINNDTNALLKLLKYVLKRYRNDKERLRHHFLYSLMSYFKLHTLSTEHWNYVIELQKILEANKEIFGGATDLAKEQIVYSLRNGIPVEELLSKHPDIYLHVDYGTLAEFKVEKDFLLQCVAHFESDSDENRKLKRFCKLLDIVMSYNSRRRDDLIDITRSFPLKWMIGKLKVYDKNDVLVTPLFTYYILGDGPREDRDEVIQLLFQKQYEFDGQILLHFLKREPWVLVKYLCDFLRRDIILEVMVKRAPKLLHSYKRLTSSGINEHVVTYYKKCLDTPCPASYKRSLLTQHPKCVSLSVLSVCMDEQEYLTIVRQYYPDETHLNTESDESTEAYQLRRSICENLKNLNSASDAMTHLLPFCIGDYLKFSLASLYHFVFHVQERKVPSVITELKGKAVSVRKHAAFFAYSTQARGDVLLFVRDYAEKEENVSVIAHLLRSTCKYFTRNRDDDFFELFKFLLKKIDKNDESTFTFITKQCKVPKIFVARYVEYVWNIIEEFGKIGFDYEDSKYALLQKLKEPDYLLLDDSFLDRIITENFLNEDKNQASMEGVVKKYLFYCSSPEKQKHRVQLIFRKLHEFKQTYYQTDMAKVCNFNGEFVEQFSNFAIKYKTVRLELVIEFKKCFSTFMSIFESFSEQLKLELLVLHVQCISENYSENFGKKTASYVAALENNYGIGAIIYCKEEISAFVKECIEHDVSTRYLDSLYLFLGNFYNASNSVAVAVVTISLLTKVSQKHNPNMNSKQTRMRYKSLTSQLKTRTEPIIQLFLNSFYRNN